MFPQTFQVISFHHQFSSEYVWTKLTHFLRTFNSFMSKAKGYKFHRGFSTKSSLIFSLVTSSNSEITKYWERCFYISEQKKDVHTFLEQEVIRETCLFGPNVWSVKSWSKIWVLHSQPTWSWWYSLRKSAMEKGTWEQALSQLISTMVVHPNCSDRIPATGNS